MDQDQPGLLRVEVVFGLPETQLLKRVRLPAGATVADAIEASGIGEAIRALDGSYEVSGDRVGVFGRKVRLEDPLEDGDRVELYRPLVVDPKEARRARAEADRAGKPAGRRG